MSAPRHPLRCEPLEDRLAPAAGDLDLTFGDGGKVVITPTTPVDQFDAGLTPAAVAVQPDGRIVVSGNTQSGRIWAARFTSDGRPDPTFGVGGWIILEQGSSKWVEGVAVDPDGRVIVVGREFGSEFTRFFAVRLTAAGQLDPTFGAIDGSAYVHFNNQNNEAAAAVAIQPDGRIVVAGRSLHDPTGTGVMAVARLTENGQLDPTFGDDGRVTVSFPVGSFDQASARAVTIQPDGAIVRAGGVAPDSGLRQIGNPHIPPVTVYFEDFAAVRLTADGRLDAGFGDGGRVRIPFDLGEDNTEAALAVGVRPDGRVVLAGAATDYFGRAIAYAAARLTADGNLDPTFDGDGKANGPSGDIDSAVVQPDGRVVFAGTEVLLMTAVGPLDPGFGSDGRVATPFYNPLDTVPFRPRGLAVQPDGNILLAGPRQSEGLVVRLLGNGPAGPGVPKPVLVGGRADGTALVLDPDGGSYTPGATLTFFPGFTGPVRTAVADVTGDGISDLIAGAGPGGGPHVRVLDGRTRAVIAEFFAFEPTFTGGVFVAAADLTGDGKAEIVVTPDQGGGPVVAIFDRTGATLTRFLGIDDPDFRGGARTALGDINGDGVPDLIVSAGFGGGPRVAVFDGTGLLAGGPDLPKLVKDFFAFEDSLRNGAFVAAGDVNGDGHADLVFGAGPGGAPRVRVFDGQNLKTSYYYPIGSGELCLHGICPAVYFAVLVPLADFFAGESSLRGGVRVATRDADGDGRAALVTGSGEEEPSRVRVYDSGTLLAGGTTPDQELDPFGAVLADGVFVG
jgi:uncharacterized delta-60 repeat protein